MQGLRRGAQQWQNSGLVQRDRRLISLSFSFSFTGSVVCGGDNTACADCFGALSFGFMRFCFFAIHRLHIRHSQWQSGCRQLWCVRRRLLDLCRLRRGSRKQCCVSFRASLPACQHQPLRDFAPGSMRARCAEAQTTPALSSSSSWMQRLV